MPEPFLVDPDVTLYHSDVFVTLREMPDESVDCVVTSPPYWGLRDYGTGEWEGGDVECDHKIHKSAEQMEALKRNSTLIGAGYDSNHQFHAQAYRDICGKCGATRIDQQLGLEPTPEQYVERMVEVFREVRRVLAAHGTVWLNLGDSYAATHHGKGGESKSEKFNDPGDAWRENVVNERREFGTIPSGLKPKDLVGVPWRVAFALQADGWYLRSDIIWAKPNPMPESVTDRPTKAHEYVFLLSKQAHYFFDQEAVREPAEWARWGDQTVPKYEGSNTKTGWMQPKTAAELRNKASVHRSGIPGGRSLEAEPSGGRNIRSVWEIATQPYPEAHFATFPEELARRCISAGTPEFVCTVCNTPVVSGRQQNFTEQEAVQEDVRRVRDSLRGSESEVLLSELRDEGSGAQPSTPADVSELRDDLLGQGQAVLLSEVLSGVDDEDGREPAAVAAGEASGELEGREVPPQRLRTGLREGTGLRSGAPTGDGGETRPTLAQDGVCSPSERDQGRQPNREPGIDDKEPASGNGGVSSLRREVRDSLSPCCNAPLRPGRVCDPFMGSGTVAYVARKLGRHAVGIDLNESYLELAARRLQQQSLFAESL